MYNLVFFKDAFCFRVLFFFYIYIGYIDLVIVNLMLLVDIGRIFFCVIVFVLGVCDSRDNYCGDFVLINDRCFFIVYR